MQTFYLLYIISVEVCNDVLDSTDPPSKPVGVVADSAKNFIKVQWEKPKRDGGAPVTGYNIERKDLRTGTWNKLNDEPITVGVVSFLACLHVKTTNVFDHGIGPLLLNSLLLFVIGCYA